MFAGPLASSGVIVITAGVLAAYILGTYIHWKLCAWVFLSVQVVMAIFVFTIPESPSWLVHKRYYSRADDALNWLGRDQEEFASEVEQDIQERMSKIVSSQTGRREPGLVSRCLDKSKCFLSRGSLIPLAIIISLFLIQNWSGFIVVIMNSGPFSLAIMSLSHLSSPCSTDIQGGRHQPQRVPGYNSGWLGASSG